MNGSEISDKRTSGGNIWQVIEWSKQIYERVTAPK